jgi:endonuclease YncB( thermonuclease family)
VRIADLPETTEIPAERDRHQILKNCRLLTAPTNDGDSFWMTTPKGTFRFDLYYADCPDLVDGYSATTQEHLQHFQGLDESALREAASAALNYVQLAAKDRSFDVITRWEQVQNIPGPFTPTFKAFVMMETSKRHYESLATYLVKNGFARTEPNCKEPLPSLQPVNEYVQLLVEHQNRAKAEFKGAWQKVPRIHQTGMTR